MSLAKAIMKKQRSLGIVSKTALAIAVGVSVPTIYKLMGGKLRPNSRTVHAYAKFLRVGASKIAQLAGKTVTVTKPAAKTRPRTMVRPGAASRPQRKGRAASR